MAKKISIDEEDYYILYLRTAQKQAKTKNNISNSTAKILPRFSHLNDLNLLESMIGQNTLLPYYHPPLEVTKEVYEQMEKVAAPALKKIILNLRRAKAIHTVYSSCQGEVE